MSQIFQQHGVRASMPSLTAASTDTLARLALDLEHSRKTGWAAFYNLLEMHGTAFAQLRRTHLINAHRTVQTQRVASEHPVQFLKMIYLAVDAMVQKWGPVPDDLARSINNLEVLRDYALVATQADQAKHDMTELSFNAGIDALKATAPEQECEECVVCLEPITPDQVLDPTKGMVFSSACLHGMHADCMARYFNTATVHGAPIGANGLPLEGKAISCPKKCGGTFTKNYVEAATKARAKALEDKAEAAKKAEASLKRKAAELDKGHDSEDDAGNPTNVLGGEGDEAPLPLDKPPPFGDKAIARRWADAKIALGHFKLLRQTAPWASTAPGQVYDFIYDGTEATYPRMIALKDAGFDTFSKKIKMTLAHPTKPDKELKAWGRAVAAEAEAEAGPSAA